MRKWSEIELWSVMSPFSVNSLFSVSVLSSWVEKWEISLLLSIDEATEPESLLQLWSMSIGLVSSRGGFTDSNWAFNNIERSELWSLRFSVARNGSFKSSLAGSLMDAGTRHFSMNCLTWGSNTFSREAGITPWKKQENDSITSNLMETFSGHNLIRGKSCSTYRSNLLEYLGRIFALIIWVFTSNNFQHAHAKRIDINQFIVVLIIELWSHELWSA